MYGTFFLFHFALKFIMMYHAKKKKSLDSEIQMLFVWIVFYATNRYIF